MENRINTNKKLNRRQWYLAFFICDHPSYDEYFVRTSTLSTTLRKRRSIFAPEIRKVSALLFSCEPFAKALAVSLVGELS